MITAGELRQIADQQIIEAHDIAEKLFVREMERIEDLLKKAAMNKLYKTTVEVNHNMFAEFADEYIGKIVNVLRRNEMTVIVTTTTERCIDGLSHTKLEVSWGEKPTHTTQKKREYRSPIGFINVKGL